MKTILLGMNNPQSEKPEHALYPYPAGCAGYRLWTMLQEASVESGLRMIDRAAYMKGFDRMNLLNSREWSAKDARASATELAPTLDGRRVVICGMKTAKTLLRGLSDEQWGVWYECAGLEFKFDYCVIPHPSGRCREYNDLEMRREVGELLLKEYLRGAVEATVGER